MLRVNEKSSDLKIVRLDGGGIPVYNYKGQPFTGFLFQNHLNGNLCFEEEYIKGFQEGWYRSYYENGNKKREYKSHNNDTIKGTYNEWDEQGNLIDSF